MTTGDVSTEQLRRLVDRLSDGLILFDREGTCLYLNPEAVRLIGKSPGELIGKPLREALPVQMTNVCAGARERLIAGDEVLLVPSYFALGRWFEILGRPLGGDFVVHFRDITERLQAESARRHSEEKFQLLVNGVKDYCLVMLDPKGVVASWNCGAERMTGYTAGEVLGKSFGSLYVPDTAETGRRLEEAVKHGSFTGERWFVRKDGSRFLARSTYTCLVDKAGIPSGFALVAQDITEQRKLEASLRRKEERLRLATEAGAVGTWEELVDEDRFIADDQYSKLTGLAPNQRFRFEDLLSKVHPDDRDHVQSERRRVLETDAAADYSNPGM